MALGTVLDATRRIVADLAKTPPRRRGGTPSRPSERYSVCTEREATNKGDWRGGTGRLNRGFCN